MATAKKSKKSNIGQASMSLGMAVAGGFVGNRASTFLESQSFLAGYESFAPAIVGLASFGAYLYLPDSVKPVAFGASIVALTDYIEGYINDATATPAVQGRFNNSMGFVPRIREGQNEEGVPTYGGGAIR
jgi:hypothetical protein